MIDKLIQEFKKAGELTRVAIEESAFSPQKLTEQEAAIISNLMETLDNGYIEYDCNGIQGHEFNLAVEQQDYEGQVIKIAGEDTYGRKQYFIGNAPYTIKVEDFPKEGLEANEYFFISYSLEGYNTIEKLFGNTLPYLDKGYLLGTVNGDRFGFRAEKQNLGTQVNVVNTDVSFINHTNEDILYRLSSAYWSIWYQNDASFKTEHFDKWDYLLATYRINLADSDKSVVIEIYNADTDELLKTATANKGGAYDGLWGGQVNAVRNIRIEANYQETP